MHLSKLSKGLVPFVWVYATKLHNPKQLGTLKQYNEFSRCANFVRLLQKTNHGWATFCNKELILETVAPLFLRGAAPTILPGCGKHMHMNDGERVLGYGVFFLGRGVSFLLCVQPCNFLTQKIQKWHNETDNIRRLGIGSTKHTKEAVTIVNTCFQLFLFLIFDWLNFF